VLGPVQVRAGECVVVVGSPQQQLLLAALAVDAGRPVTVDTLVDRLWDQAPDGARRTLYVLITRLRRMVEQATTGGEKVRVVRSGGGYVLEIDPQRVDLLRFRRLVAEARGSQCTGEKRVVLLRQAVALWQGEPLSGLAGDWAGRTRQGLRHQHLDAVVAWAQAELDDGDPAAVLDPLTELAGEHPLAESLTEVLMRVLYATGRPAQALSVYAATQLRLADELGTDPGPDLQAVHQQILRGTLGPQHTTGPHDTHLPTVPQQLPAAVAHFTGRTGELAALTGLLRSRAKTGGTVVISAVSGTAGVGKTALAVHWAHQVADQFPDGQLYVNLRGFDPSGSVLDPAVAVRRFLDALQVPPERVPVDLDAQAALYRRLLSDRQVLVVLDNARDTSQVRPLLPGAPGCLVVVTSRNQLTGLVAADGAHPITLDLLTEAEARELLSRRIGANRTAAEPGAVQEIITRCARLPLALTIVAARAATYPQFRLRTLAAELRDAGDRLDVLTGDDPHSDVRAVFSWSYRTLSLEAARVFRLLGLHPGPDLSAPAAASLAGLPLPEVRPLLVELARANLIVEHIPGRYVLHDLLCAYAADLSQTTDSDPQRHAATHRMLDHYLHTAYTADRLLYSNRDLISLSPPQPGTTLEHPTDHDQALAWFTSEHAVLLATAGHAAATGFDSHTWPLAWTLANYLDWGGHWHDLAATGRAAMAAAHRLADPTAQARAHRYLAVAYMLLGRLEDAHTQLRHALDLATQSGDLTGQANIHHTLAQVWGRQGHHAKALEHAGQALHLFGVADHQVGQAIALNAVGWCHAQLGEHQQALTYCQQALTQLQELHHRHGLADTWDNIGYAQHHLGHHTHAITSYQHAIHLYQDLGNRYYEATTLTHLGDTHHTTRNHHAARDAWQQALTILNDLHHPDADQLRTTLATLDPPSLQPR